MWGGRETAAGRGANGDGRDLSGAVACEVLAPRVSSIRSGRPAGRDSLTVPGAASAAHSSDRTMIGLEKPYFVRITAVGRNVLFHLGPRLCLMIRSAN